MKKEGYQQAALAFTGSLEHLEFIRCSGGWINQSFRVKNQASTTSFFLQQINTKVFPSAQILQDNYLTIWKNLSSIQASLRIPQPLKFINGDSLYIDQENHAWRVTEFIEGSTHFVTATQEEQLHKAAEAFGAYARALANVDPQTIQPVILQFHDLHFRWRQFQEAIELGLPERKQETEWLISELCQRKFYVDQYLAMQQSPEQFPVRLLHHDAKIANLLFDESGNQVIAIIDLDTTMPGLFFSDLGDMIRSMACEQGEQCTNWDQLKISSSRYRLLVEGYLSSMSNHFTRSEKESVHYAGLFMLYMQALRFLSDYLTGDHYYQTERVGQNRDRAINQYTLLNSLEQLLKNEYGFRVS